MANPGVGSRQGIRATDTNFSIGGTTYFTGSGTPKSVITPNRIGDFYTDYTNGDDWVATGLTNTSWMLAGSISGTGVEHFVTYNFSSVALINAGAVILPAVTGRTYTVTEVALNPLGTAAAGTNLLVQDTAGSPVICTTATQVALATAANGWLTSSALVTGWTLGAGYRVPLTANKGVQLTATGTFTTMTGLNVQIKYIIT